MTTPIARPFAGESDLQPLVDLINICESVDRIESGTSLAELRAEINSPSLDQQRDLRLWQHESGELIAFGQLWIRPAHVENTIDGNLWFFVHPEARGTDLETEIITWAEGRMREIRSEKGAQTRLYCGARDDDGWRTSIMQGHGFTPARYFLRMVRPLDQPISEPQLPEGFILRQVEGEHEIPAWVEMFNESFIDHWNHHPLTVEQVLYWLESDPFYNPQGDLIAVAPDGTFAAFCFCSINPEENERNGCNEGWINVLGTRRGFRNIGLGRAMLLAGLRWLKDQGMDFAKLGVDSENPTGATRLYESVGFYPAYTLTSYSKEV
ncbi:MAG: GNAT family acetyltransferase [Herpetosiphonaceae bacterium]|nr:MAG: GNAT family acetyltransferase [Herpetosiphonaceae bacterium]